MISIHRSLVITFTLVLMLSTVVTVSQGYSQTIPIYSASEDTPVYQPSIIQNWETSRVRDIFVIPDQDLYFIATSADGIMLLRKTTENTFEKVPDDSLYWSQFQINTLYGVAATAVTSPTGEISGYLFLAAGAQGLIAFNYSISNRYGLLMSKMWTYRQEASITQQVLLGDGIMKNKLIVTEGPQGLSILDISDPTILKVSYTIPITQFFGKITYRSFISNDLLFVSNGEEGLVEFKVTPTSYLRYAIYKTEGIQGLTISSRYVPEIDAVITSEGEFGALIYQEKGSELLPTPDAEAGYVTDGYLISLSVASSESGEATLILSKTYAGWEEIKITQKNDGTYTISPIKKVEDISASLVLKITDNPEKYLVGGWDGNISYVSLHEQTNTGNQAFLDIPIYYYMFLVFVIMPVIRKLRK